MPRHWGNPTRESEENRITVVQLYPKNFSMPTTITVTEKLRAFPQQEGSEFIRGSVLVPRGERCSRGAGSRSYVNRRHFSVLWKNNCGRSWQWSGRVLKSPQNHLINRKILSSNSRPRRIKFSRGTRTSTLASRFRSSSFFSSEGRPLSFDKLDTSPRGKREETHPADAI